MDYQNDYIQAGRWLTDILIDLMISPGWKYPIQDFIDQYCECFEDTEENKLIYSEIHEEFSSMVEGMLENLSNELGVSEGILVGVLDESLRNRKISYYFEYILATVDFLVFKRIMVKRNIEIEIETRKNLKILNNKAKQEEADLKLALALSMIDREEYEAQRIEKRIKEDEELRRALELSSTEIFEDMQREKLRVIKEIEEAKELLRKKESLYSINDEEVAREAVQVKQMLVEARAKAEEEMKREQEEMGNMQKLREMKKKIEVEKEKLNKMRKEGEAELIQRKIQRKRLEDSLGSTEDKKSVSVEEEKSIDESEEQEVGEEELEKRKERLKAQRDQVLKKIKQDRYAALCEHMNNGGVDFTYRPESVSLQEMNKRKKILNKLKEGGNLPVKNLDS